MDTRRLVPLLVLLVLLIGSVAPGRAEEKAGTVVTALHTTTISGYVDVSVGRPGFPAIRGDHKGWWHGILSRLFARWRA